MNWTQTILGGVIGAIVVWFVLSTINFIVFLIQRRNRRRQRERYFTENQKYMKWVDVDSWTVMDDDDVR
jgi:cyanate permease